MDEALNAGMSEKFKLDIFRIVQEQLNNIIRHAKASLVRIGFFQKETGIVLTVADNGVGFDMTKNADGIGILNIKSRIALHKGNADFMSKPGKGCVLTVTFPIEYFIKEQL